MCEVKEDSDLALFVFPDPVTHTLSPALRELVERPDQLEVRVRLGSDLVAAVAAQAVRSSGGVGAKPPHRCMVDYCCRAARKLKACSVFFRRAHFDSASF